MAMQSSTWPDTYWEQGIKASYSIQIRRFHLPATLTPILQATGTTRRHRTTPIQLDRGQVSSYSSAGAPLFWQSKLQTVISLSTAKSELIALSEASRFVKSMMYLLDELNDQGIEASSLPEVYCNIFEDNAAALEISKVPKVRPRTRHINVLYHHFRAEVQNNRVKIHPIKTDREFG